MANKPRSGPYLTDAYCSDELAYKPRICPCQQDEITRYTNDLH